MDELTVALRRSLDDRLAAFAERISDARAAVSAGHSAYRAALDLLDGFPQAVASLADAEMVREDAEGVAPFLRQLLRHMFDVVNFADRWLFGAAELHDDQSLLAAVQREAEALGLGERHAIVVPGGADNFVTRIDDPNDVVFEPLIDAGWEGQVELAADFVLLQVPAFEGRGGPWRPVILGHELAHLAVEEHDALDRLDLAERLDLDAVPVDPDRPREPQVLNYLRIAESWTTELLCDAHAVRRFGPAGFAAMAEFLTAVGALSAISPSHPPATLRLHLMLHWMGEIEPAYAAITAQWEDLATPEAPTGAPDWHRTLVDHLVGLADDMLAVANWSEPYGRVERRPIVAYLVERLKGGIPGSELVDVGNGIEPVTDADVVNAGWLARTAEATVPVDALVAKNLDTPVFVQRWVDSGGQLEQLPGGPVLEDDGLADSEQGLLSGDELRVRMRRDDDRQLVVTPLLAGALGAAGIDVRLGNRFIVFQRTSIAQFDPLSDDDDPRAVQRKVVRPWGDPFILHPGELVLAATIEYLRVPADLSAQVITRSSYGRLGLITATAVQVNPGFRGCLTLELVNLGEVPLQLTPGERIAQLTFTTTRPAAAPQPSKYDCPTGPQFSAVHQDPDVPVLRKLRGGRQNHGRDDDGD